MPVSQWLTNVAERAASEQAALADGLAAVTEFEAENGAFTDAERARARQVLYDTGAIPSYRRRDAS